MTNSFFNRVEAERAILAVVNRSFMSKAQLAGLSSGALENWRSRSGLEQETQQTLMAILRELGDACQRLSDRSHETFAPLEKEVEQRLSIGIDALKAALSGLQRNSRSF